MSEPIELMAIGLTTLDIAVHPVTALPLPDQGELVETIRLSPAGTAAGTALVAAKLGLRAAVVSAVGNDPQGRIVRDMLAEAGVEVSLLETSNVMPTSTTVLPIAPDGSRPNLHMVGASMIAPIPMAAYDTLHRTRVVHFGAVGFPGTIEGGAQFLAAAQASGAFVSCDLIAPRDVSRTHLDQLLPHIDLFMPSLTEVEFLAGTRDIAAAAAQFMAKGAKACLFKLGGDGAVLTTSDGTITVPAFAIRPVDTTSCGDSLCTGYHAALVNGLVGEAALRFASAVAAQVALGVGTTGALVGYDETLAFARDTPTVKKEPR